MQGCIGAASVGGGHFDFPLDALVQEDGTDYAAQRRLAMDMATVIGRRSVRRDVRERDEEEEPIVINESRPVRERNVRRSR